MDNPNDILEKLSKSNERLRKANRHLQEASVRKATAERDYRVALAMRELELKREKYPATLIMDLARGTEEVADLKLERDKLDAIYDAKKYEINSIHTEISVLQTQLNWYKQEYAASNYTNGG